jgi:hypothetical protein
MRPLLAILCLVAVIAAAPTAEASCHFCLEKTVASCSSLQAGACMDNGTYMATHIVGHLLEPACAEGLAQSC